MVKMLNIAKDAGKRIIPIIVNPHLLSSDHNTIAKIKHIIAPIDWIFCTKQSSPSFNTFCIDVWNIILVFQSKRISGINTFRSILACEVENQDSRYFSRSALNIFLEKKIDIAFSFADFDADELTETLLVESLDELWYIIKKKSLKLGMYVDFKNFRVMYASLLRKLNDFADILKLRQKPPSLPRAMHDSKVKVKKKIASHQKKRSLKSIKGKQELENWLNESEMHIKI